MPDGAVLVLNRLYQAVQVTGARRGLRLFYAGRARAVGPDFETYDFENWCDLPPRADDDIIRTPRRAIRVPRVIQLTHYDKLPRREVRFTRQNIFYRDRNHCQYCGKVFPQKELNLDHVVPLSRGGTSSWDNVVCACIACNSRKGNRLPQEAGMHLVRLPRRPAGHPVLRAGWIGPRYAEWRSFLDEAYWNVELAEEIVPRRFALEKPRPARQDQRHAGCVGDVHYRLRHLRLGTAQSDRFIEDSYALRVMLLNPYGAGARRRIQSLGMQASLETYRQETEATIERLAALAAAGKKVTLKLYEEPPFWNLIVTGEYVWVQYCDDGQELKNQPEYVFALRKDKPAQGLFPAFYVHFLNHWNDPRHPEYDLRSKELIYRNDKGNEVGCIPYQPHRHRRRTRARRLAGGAGA